ncbi:mechanosensitive ion channel family protein, partial [Halovivax sp.]|uniref:mechanosensitive ion channel family protein n=1 Tax=Halovivax sp. TaxID=1935978 RepID=UPI0025BAE4BE
MTVQPPLALFGPETPSVASFRSTSPSVASSSSVSPSFVVDAVGTLGASWLLAALAVVAAWVGSKLLAERLRPRLERRVLRPTTANAVLLVGRAVVVAYAFLPFAGLLGFRPQNVLLSFTVLSLVLGAVLAPVARSYVSGLFVLFNRPYEVGDMVELVEREERGYVDDITLGYTRLSTLGNSFLVIPNETMRERDIRNLSAEDERSRLSIAVRITYESDLDRACELLADAARGVDGVLAGGPSIRVGRSRFPAEPRAFVDEFGDHGVRLVVRLWTEEPYLPRRVRSAVHRAVWSAFDDANVEFAYPHTHHVFDETSGRARVALDRPGGERVDDGADHDGDADRTGR